MKAIRLTLLTGVAMTLLAVVVCPQVSCGQTTQGASEHHSCEGSSWLGGKCSATCPDRCGCTCDSGIFSCDCECECPDGPTSSGGETTQVETPCRPDIAPKEKWEVFRNAVAQEDSETARQILAGLDELYQLGSTKNPAYCEKARQMDALVEKLQPATIQAILVAFHQSQGG